MGNEIRRRVIEQIQERPAVRAFYFKDGDGELACGKCKAIIEPVEIICPVCGALNDINGAIQTTKIEVFRQI